MKTQDMTRCIEIVYCYFLNSFVKLFMIIKLFYYYILYLLTTSYHTSYHNKNKKRGHFIWDKGIFYFLNTLYKSNTFYPTSYHKFKFKTRKCLSMT